MMKKRILASSMASVMALSSISVVAFADEKDYGEAVSKADLEAFLKAEVDFVETKLESYGSKQGEKYQAALDHCQKVVDDAKSEAKDYSAAYQMAKAVKAELAIYTADQLKALIKENQAKYDQNNIMNEELQDLIYKEDKYADFTVAFDDAQNYVDSEDSRLITDAYIALEDAVKALAELPSISKSDFRAAMKQYEAVRLELRKYESWRRGTLTVKATETEANNWGDLQKCNVTLAQVEDLLFKSGKGKDDEGNVLSYWKDTEWKNVKPVDKKKKDVDTWFAKKDLNLTNGVYGAINSEYDRFDNIKSAVQTTDPTIVAACKTALDAVKVFEGWEVDSYRSGSKSSCATLLSKYHNQLVDRYDSTTPIADVEVAIEKLGEKYKVTTDADAVMKCEKGFFIVLNEDGYLKDTASIAADDTKLTAAAGEKIQKVAANTNIYKYLAVDTISLNDGNAKTKDDKLKKAYDNYAKYLTVDWDDDKGSFSIDDAQTLINSLADGKTIPEVKGSTTEWTIIWRQLAYALEDSFPKVKETTYTLAQLKASIDKAYDLAEETGDSAVFAEVHQDLVDKRQIAIEFYTDAKATTGYKTDMTINGTDLATVCKALDDACDLANKWIADFKYSYEDIRTTIGETAIAVDNGDIKSDAVVKALADCAYDLSVLEHSDVILNSKVIVDDNCAFDEERIFQGVNRLKTDSKKQTDDYTPNTFEKNLKNTYEKLLKAIEEAKGGATTGVKNDFNGDGAFTAADLTAILDAYTASSTDTKYDANGDGSFGIADLTFALEAFTAQV